MTAMSPQALSLISGVAVLFLIAFKHLYFWNQSGSKNANGIPRPPLVPYWVPYIGSALSMASGDRFWDRTRAKYGDVVRINVAGQERIFLQSTELIAHVYKASKSFDFPHLRKSLQVSMFGTTYETSFAEIMSDRLFPAHHRALQPRAIEKTIGVYAEWLERLLSERLDTSGEHEGEIDLVDMVYDVIYTASSKAFFGPTFPSSTSMPLFIAFDAAIPLLSLDALPTFLKSSALDPRSKLTKLLVEWYTSTSASERESMAPSIVAMRECAEADGWSAMDWSTLVLSSLWALEANAPYAGIWTIVEILRRPQLVSRLRTEIASAYRTLSPPTLSTLLRLPQPEIVARLPGINACLQETLRVHTSSNSIRRVTEDLILPPGLCGNGNGNGNGKETGYAISKGEQVVCVTRARQIDQLEEGGWGPDAGRWDHTRWLDGDDDAASDGASEGAGAGTGAGASGEKGTSGLRSAASARKGSMWPFGGGTSMCEGRHFASAEILAFIAAFISLADVKVISDSIHVNTQRQGLGVLQPKGKMVVKMAKRI